MRPKTGRRIEFLHHFLHHLFQKQIQNIKNQPIVNIGCNPASSTTLKRNYLVIRWLRFFVFRICVFVGLHPGCSNC
jgi:hypothetical protein